MSCHATEVTLRLRGHEWGVSIPPKSPRTSPRPTSFLQTLVQTSTSARTIMVGKKQHLTFIDSTSHRWHLMPFRFKFNCNWMIEGILNLSLFWQSEILWLITPNNRIWRWKTANFNVIHFRSNFSSNFDGWGDLTVSLHW